MTPLPKHLEELRDQLAHECDAQDYRYQGLESYMPMDNEDFYKAGFNSAVDLMLKFYEMNWHTTQSNPKKILPNPIIIDDVGETARATLKNYKDKYYDQ